MKKQTDINTLRSFNSDYNKLFVRQAIRNALLELLASVLEDGMRIHAAFETTVAQSIGTIILAKKVAKVLRSDLAVQKRENSSKKNASLPQVNTSIISYRNVVSSQVEKGK